MRSWPRELMLITIVLFSLAACSGSPDNAEDISAQTVRAESFELTDSEGVVRAALEMKDGSPQFVLVDPAGGNRLQISLDETGNAALSLFDANGGRRVGFEFANGINPALFLRDEAGRLKAGMQVQSQGAPLIFLRNSALEDGFAVTLVEENFPVLALADQRGNNRVFLGLDSQGSGSLVFVNEDGTVESVTR